MASFTHVVKEEYITDGITVGSAPSQNSYVGSAPGGFSELIAVGVDTFVNVAIDISAVKSIILLSDRAVTIETNANNHSGGDQIVLKAGIPYIWTTDSYYSCLITLDVTGGFYITNASGGSAQVDCRFTYDATP